MELGFLAYWQMGMYLDTLPRLYSDEGELMAARKQIISDIDQLKLKIYSLPLKDFAPFQRNNVANP
ncbi:hypothetical protein QKW52_13030 [Bacillus sonorensis]|nr:hypothetical protein [Bacillus sonorensis]